MSRAGEILRRRPVAAALLAVAAAALAGALNAGRRPGMAGALSPAAAPTQDRLQLIREAHLPNVLLKTQRGETVRFYDDLVAQRVVAINFMYTLCERSCPISMENLARARDLVQRLPGPAVSFLSLSLDPEHDLPDVLAAYATAHASGPDWTFATGASEDIEALRIGLGAYDPDPSVDKDRSQHTGLVIIGNDVTGRWKAIPTLTDPVRIAQAIERIRTPVAQWVTGKAAVEAVPYEETSIGSSPVTSAELDALLELTKQ